MVAKLQTVFKAAKLMPQPSPDEGMGARVPAQTNHRQLTHTEPGALGWHRGWGLALPSGPGDPISKTSGKLMNQSPKF